LEIDMKTHGKIVLALASLGWMTQALAQITFYENDGFTGRSFTAQGDIRNFDRAGFNDRASSVVVRSQRWEVCEDVRFNGRCVILRPGQYPSLAAMGMNDRVSSVRAVNSNSRFEDDRYSPPPPVSYDYRQRDNERLFQAQVTSVRAVVTSPSQQRCWVDREQVVQQDRNQSNPGGAVIGAVLGGILGHQVGGGGRDAATAIGAVGGAVLGSNMGRSGGGQQVVTQDVQRCENVPNQRPDYFDVTYEFNGREYRVQMTNQPGAYVSVNRNGEPRV
jgi:uncharacterized protein YcfJ